MKRIIIICLICLYSVKGHTQLFENKTNIYFGYQTGLFLGNELFNDNGMIAPSYYSNFKSIHGLGFKEIVNLSDYFSAGYRLGLLQANNWRSANYTSYNSSRSTIISLQPVFQVHNKFTKNGIFNRLKVYGELSPVLGMSFGNVTNNIFNFIGASHITFKTNNFIYGLQAGIGSEYAFSNKFGLFLDLSIQHSFTNSPFFIDTNYTLSGVNMGFFVNLNKVKRFNY